MQHDLIVTGSVEVNADPEKVWDAMTNPEIIKEYLFGTQTITDWQPGSEIMFQGEYGENLEFKYRDKGIVLRNIPFKVISYTYWSGFSGLEDKPDNYGIVTYSINNTGQQTRLTWTQEGYANDEGYERAQSGMEAFLNQIKGVMERRNN
jgi:uncharacterized protein YndB with AHSA1/START domain